MARWLVGQGALNLVLVGRSGGSPATESVIREFEDAGVRVLSVREDVSRFDRVSELFVEIERMWPPLAGVMHAAGVFADRLIVDQEWRLFEEVFAPKIHGAWNLHRLTENLPLDFFVLFSSASTILGGAGLSNYVAANEFLNALAAYRRRIGLPGLSIAWGPWAGVGMAKFVGGAREAEWEAIGMRPLAPADALHALSQVIRGEAAEVGVMSLDWTRFRSHPSSAALAGFLEFLAPRRESEAEGQRSAIRIAIGAGPAGERRQLLLAHVRAEVEAVLGWDPADRVNVRHGFFDLGMDSLQANDLRNRLQTALGCPLPPTLTFKFPTVAALADHLAGELFGRDEECSPAGGCSAEPGSPPTAGEDRPE
ncbi:MAG: beta-ketoacyl reductase, partial [Gammaproteobacteria bacterium]